MRNLDPLVAYFLFLAIAITVGVLGEHCEVSPPRMRACADVCRPQHVEKVTAQECVCEKAEPEATDGK